MKKVFPLFWILSIVSIFLTSCSSDEDTSNGITLLRKIESVDLGQHAKHQFFYKGTKLTKVVFEKEAQTDGNGYDKYSYTNDLITEIKTYNNNNQIDAVTTLTYNSNNQLTEVLKLEPSRNYGLRTVFNYTLFGTVVITSYSGNLQSQNSSTNQTTTLSLLNGEIIRKEFTSAEMNYIVEYEYDVKNNPMKNVTGYQAVKLYAYINNGLFGMNHNLAQQTTYLVLNVIDNQVDFELQYNNDNFPTSRYATGSFSGAYQYQYEYYN